MKRIYKISLDIIGIMLIILLMVAASYIQYKKNGAESAIVLVEDGLSINYLNGNKIQPNKNAVTYMYSITNNSDTNLSYYIQFSNIKNYKNGITYKLSEKNNAITEINAEFPDKDSYIVSLINIEPNTTHTYTLTINDKHTNIKADVKIGIEELTQDNFAMTLLKNNEIKKEAATSIGSGAAVNEEGLIKTVDELGESYYFRGAVNNNYVSFANNLWRIVKINGDGTIKLILNDYLPETANYYNLDNTSSIIEKLKFANTNIETILSNFYQTNLEEYDKYLVSTRYCVDDSVAEANTTTYYLGYSRLLTDYNQTYNCLGTTFNSRIGLLTADEAVFAGASKNSENTSFYLYTPGKSNSWWTMTPASSTDTTITYFEISEKGQLKADSVGSYYRGVKPVINLAKRTYVSGLGTQDNPYILMDL